MIRAIPRYRPICVLLNQFYSLLSRSISISLRLNSSAFFLALKTFKKEEDIFIFNSFKDKIFLYLVSRHKKENEATKLLFLGGRHGQGIKDITRNINNPKMALNVLQILSLQTYWMHGSSIINLWWGYCALNHRFFCFNELSLYPHNIVGILIKLIFFKGGIFSQ